MADRFAAFRHSSYSRYFTSRFMTAFAAQIVSVSVAWQIYDETQNPIYLGWIGLVQFLPALLLVFVTGLASDTFGRRLVMGLAILVEMACAAGILFLAATNQFHPVWVLAILTLFGVARAFLSPASASLAVNVVPREDFANAVGWNASAWQMASIVGPVVGSLLYGVSHVLAYSTATVMFAIAAMLIFSIPKPPQRVSTEPKTLSVILGGFTYVWKQKVVLGAISLDLFAVLLGGAVALMPVYARDILEVGETGLGLLRAAPGIGALLVTAVITAFPIREHAGKILFVCVGLFGLSTVVFGYSTVAWLSILALVCVGAFDMVSVYIREVLLQLWTPDQVRGRVNAVNSIFLGASNELGEARAGFMAAKWGAVFTVVAGGYAAVGIAAAWSVLFPGIRKASNLHEGNPDG
ncbi:MAG: MFS transporter [Alphaproteobacteria bacterium]|nr:MFS transporter [Alphaproteobacteria bacterium]MBU2083587.1 MFS transporter [Alphaproteobacteria bacterium]MBU2143232.1 MFS transporter [Alphaproteobacteria bacterium]MBU2195053.1 MFS transporter [Alphaproteobacteria bacterium]